MLFTNSFTSDNNLEPEQLSNCSPPELNPLVNLLTERTTQLVGQGKRNEAKAKNAAEDLLEVRSLLEAQSRGNVAKANTQAKTCNNSANVTYHDSKSVCYCILEIFFICL